MKLVILDRDGVINQESRAYIKSPSEWLPLPGSLEAIAKLTKSGYTVVITTNQSGVGRGFLNLEMLHAIHTKMENALMELDGKIDRIYYCPHLPDDGCNCRKPKTGMLEQLATDYSVNLSTLNPPYIGDSMRDMEVALATGCKFYLTIGPGGDGHETLQKLSINQQERIIIVEDLAAAVEHLIQ